jgi:hypothetical protein
MRATLGKTKPGPFQVTLSAASHWLQLIDILENLFLVQMPACFEFEIVLRGAAVAVAGLAE